MDELYIKSHLPQGYSNQSPYPEIKVTAPNPQYIELLRDAYAGVDSELTAITQYTYQSMMTKENEKDIKEMLTKISINEMLHLEIFAELIKLLGGNPIYRGSYSTHNNYWNGSFVYYGNSLCDRLKTDLGSEHDAIRTYNEYINRIHDPYIQNVLRRIIMDEQFHAHLFTEAVKKYNC